MVCKGGDEDMYDWKSQGTDSMQSFGDGIC